MVDIDNYAHHAVDGSGAELKEVVLGLHWDPPQEDADTRPADLDAVCMLFGMHGKPLEVVHPGNPRSRDGAVIHTGDSRTGASQWDDERIFVFLNALPQSVVALTFVVASPAGLPLAEVRGASCHLSDHASEQELLRVEFAGLQPATAYRIATLTRSAAGWRISTDAHPLPEPLKAMRRLQSGSA